MKLILRNQYIKLANYQLFNPQKIFSKSLTLFTLATVVTGVNYYFQSFIASTENDKQRQLIQRVSNDETAEDFLYKFDYHQTDQWECKKIILDGSIRDGRFLVKRNRGNEQGYIVLAPFTVQNYKALSTKRKVQRKFILNMGWIPKNSKHLVKTLTAADTIGENEYTEENRVESLEKQRYDQLLRDPRHLGSMSTITTVEAYVRKGQQKEILNGLNNWKDRKFYKFIDLPWLCRLFRISNEAEAGVIYLERVPKNEEESEVVPIPTNKQHVIDDLKERIQLNNKSRDINIAVVGAGSIVSAILLAVI